MIGGMTSDKSSSPIDQYAAFLSSLFLITLHFLHVFSYYLHEQYRRSLR